jgi:hypothetical protein
LSIVKIRFWLAGRFIVAAFGRSRECWYPYRGTEGSNLALSARIASLENPSEHDDDLADILPELHDRSIDQQARDLWLLGLHRVLCGKTLDGRASVSSKALWRRCLVDILDAEGKLGHDLHT